MVEAAGIEPASVGGRCCLASCISRPRYAIGGIEGGIRTSLPPLAAMPPSRDNFTVPPDEGRQTSGVSAA